MGSIGLWQIMGVLAIGIHIYSNFINEAETKTALRANAAYYMAFAILLKLASSFP